MTALTIYNQATSKPTNARGVSRMVDNQSHPGSAGACHNGRKPKGPMLENIFGNAVATPTDKRGFVMSELVRRAPARAGMVAGRMGHTVRLAARRYPCFQHPAHPRSVKTARVASESRNGAKTMTVIHLAARAAAPISTAKSSTASKSSTFDSTDPELIRLSAAAENALAAALALLRDPAGTAQDLQRATARAIRAGTLLKRACAQVEGGAA